MTDFKRYGTAGFSGEILPILPPDAKLSENSSVALEMRGKVPGSFDHGTGFWSGLAGWNTRVFETERLTQWSRWPLANIGLRAALYPGLDFDCSEMIVVDFAIDAAFRHFGPAPVRGRPGSSRCLLVYRLKAGEIAPRKIRIAFRLPGDETIHAFEMLAAGQQYVIEGAHASGTSYAWDGEIDLSVVGSAGLVEVTAEQWNSFRQVLVDLLKDLGATIVNVSSAGSASETERKPIGDESLTAGDLAELARALSALDCSSLDYDAWVSVIHAAKAASGGDEMFFADVFLPWSLAYPGNDESVVRSKWDSVGTSAIGAKWLFGLAREHGFVGGVDEFDVFPETEEEKADKAAEKAATDELFERFVYVLSTGTYYDRKERMSVDNKGLCHLMPSLGQVNHATKNAHWLMQRNAGGRTKTVFGLGYAPGGSVVITLDGRLRANTWRDCGVKPLDGDAGPWLDHMKLMIPDEKARNYSLDWMAHKCQRRGLKPNWHLLFWSEIQGVGKNMMIFPLERFFAGNVSSPTTATLAGAFTPYYGAELIIGDEIECTGRAGTKIYEKLKVALAGSDIVEVNLKNEKQIMARNSGAWIFFSNKPDAIRLERGDRRLMINHIAMNQEEHDRLAEEGYYKRLADWLGMKQEDPIGARIVLGYLLKRDVSNFDYGGEAPRTDAKLEMVRQALPETIQHIMDLREEGARFLQGDLLDLREVITRLQNSGAHAFRGAFTDKAVSAALKEMGFRRTDHQKRFGSDTKRRLWVAGEVFDRYNTMPEKALAAAYAEQRGEDGRIDGLAVVT